MSHWATPLIGMPYELGASGPDAFDCWGLVRHVFLLRWGIEMPVVAIGATAPNSAANVAAIKRAAEVSGWRPAELPMVDGDIVLMTGTGGRHVGVMIEADRQLRLLHSFETAGACTQTLQEAGMAGFHSFEPWRRS